MDIFGGTSCSRHPEIRKAKYLIIWSMCRGVCYECVKENHFSEEITKEAHRTYRMMQEAKKAQADVKANLVPQDHKGATKTNAKNKNKMKEFNYMDKYG